MIVCETCQPCLPAMIGNETESTSLYFFMSSIHPLCESTLSQDNASSFTFRFSKSAACFAKEPSSVVQTMYVIYVCMFVCLFICLFIHLFICLFAC